MMISLFWNLTKYEMLIKLNKTIKKTIKKDRITKEATKSIGRRKTQKIPWHKTRNEMKARKTKKIVVECFLDKTICWSCIDMFCEKKYMCNQKHLRLYNCIYDWRDYSFLFSFKIIWLSHIEVEGATESWFEAAQSTS